MRSTSHGLNRHVLSYSVMDGDFLDVGSGETLKIPWTEAVNTPTASSAAPGPPFPSYSDLNPTKRQKPPRKLAVKLEGLTQTRAVTSRIYSGRNVEGRSGGESDSPPYTDEMSSLASITAAAASGNADAWDPMSFDYQSPEFNSYTSGPGVLMQSINTDSNENKNICLFVDHIPTTITKEGLRNLFSKAGVVRRVNIVKPRPGTSSSYGFVEYSTVREAESAMQLFNNFDMGHGIHLIVKVSTSNKDKQKRLEQQRESEAFLKTLNCVKKSGGSGTIFEKEDYELSKEETEKCEENPLVPRYIPHPNSSPDKPKTAVSGSVSPTKTVLTSSDGAASLRAPSSFTIPHVSGNGRSPPGKDRTSRATSTSSGSGKGGSKEQPCNVCQSATVNKCSRCKMPYCSAACQRKDWSVHKTQCKARTSEQHDTTASAASPPRVDENNVSKQPNVSKETTELKIAEDFDDDGFHISSYDDEEGLQSLQTLLQNVRAGKEPLMLKKPSAFTALKSPQGEATTQRCTIVPHASPEVSSLYGLDKSPGSSAAIEHATSENSTLQSNNLKPLKSPSSFEETYSLFGDEIVVSLSAITSQLYNTSQTLMSVPLLSPLPQKFTAIVTSISSCVRFSAIVASVEVKQALKKLQDYGAKATCTYVEASELTEGSRCGYKNRYGEFFRVIVRCVHNDKTVSVTLCDFGGHLKLPASVLFRLPDEIVTIPALRQRLSIQNLRSQNTVDSCKFLFELIQGRPVIVRNRGTVRLKNNPKISFVVCELESTLGTSISDAVAQSKFASQMDVASPTNSITGIETISIKSPPVNTVNQYKLVHYANKVPFHNPPHGFFEIKPTLVVGPSVIWAHVIHPHIATLSRLQDDLNARYQPVKNTSYAPVQGEICVAKFSQDQCYYRAEVLCVNHNGTVDVHYVDFGNRDTVMIAQLRHIDPVFLTFPKQALQFSIGGIVPANTSQIWSDNAIAFIKDKITNRRVRVRIVSETPSCYLIDLFDPDSQTEQLLNAVMVSLGHAQALDGAPTVPRIPTPSMPSGSLVGVSVGHKTPNAIESFHAVTSRFTSPPTGPRTPPLPDSGRSTPRSEDGTSQISPRTFGNLSSPRNSLTPLSLKSSTQRQSEGKEKPTTLTGSAGRSTSRGSRVATLNSALSSLQNSPSPTTPNAQVRWKRFGSPKAGVIPSPSDPKKPPVQSPLKETPRLFNVGATQEKRYYSSKRSIQSVKIKVDQTVQVIVSHVDHPLKFWVQLADQVSLQEILRLLEMLNEATLTPIASPHAGELCLCSCSSDNKVNRGRVMEIANRYATVEFIDYGSKEEVALDNIFEIDSKIVEVPAQAVMCTVNCLLNPNGKGNPWDPKGIEFFKSKVCTQSPVTIKCVKVVGIMNVVDLTLATGEDMLQVLDQSRYGNAYRLGKSSKEDLSRSGSSGNSRSPQKSGGKLNSGGFSAGSPNQKKTSSPFTGFGSTRSVQDNANKRSPFASSSTSYKTTASPSPKIEKVSEATDTSSSAVHREKSPFHRTTASQLPPTSISQSLSPKYPLVADMKKGEVSKTIQVMVSEIHSPDSIFFQTATQQTAMMLNDLSTNLSTHFQTTTPPAIVQPPSKGSLVCAKFSQDGAWYRGEVLESCEGVCKVRFIDYGNIDSVQLSDMSPCPSQFVSIPVLAVECALNGIIPAGINASWSSQATSFLTEKTADCILQANIAGIRERDGVPLVELLDNSGGSEVNIAREMVSQGLALNKQSVRNKLPDGPSKQQQAVSPKLQFIQVASLMKAEIPSNSTRFQVLVSEVHNPDSIFFQTATQQTAMMLNDLASDLNTHFQTTAPPAIVQPPSKGSLVCAKFSQDGAWYRGEVLESCEGLCKVRFIDYGNTDSVQLSDMSPCPSQFVSVPVLAVECALNGVTPLSSESSWSSQATSFLKEKTADCILQASIAGVQERDGVPLVELVNGSEVNIACEMVSQRLALNKQTYACNKLPDGPSKQQQNVSPKLQFIQVASLMKAEIPSNSTRFQVLVSEVHNPDSIFFQTATQQTAMMLNDLASDLNTHFQTTTPPAIVQPPSKGSLVCAKFSQDGAWYRGEVLESCEGVCKVRFIDYGNIDSVQLSDMSPCPGRFVSIPVLAVECALNGIIPAGKSASWSSQATSFLKEKAADCILQASIVGIRERDGVLLVELVNDSHRSGVNLAHEMVSQGIAFKKQPGPSKHLGAPPKQQVIQQVQQLVQVSKLKRAEFPMTLPFQVFVSEVHSPDSIFFQTATQQTAMMLNDLSTNLSTHFQTTAPPGIVQPPSKGSLVCAKFSQDGAWYRGEVLESCEGVCKVQFIDYGNTDSVQLSDMSPCPSQFVSIPVLAVECALNGVMPLSSESSWAIDSKATFLLKKLCQDCVLQANVISSKTGSQLLIDLCATIDGMEVNIASELIKKGLAKSSQQRPTQEPPPVQISTVKLPSGTPVKVLVSDCTSPSSVWLQLFDKEKALALHNMMTELQQVYANPSKYAGVVPSVGMVCCSKYADDDSWYRCRVKLVSGKKVTVEYIDFGNSATVSPNQLFSLGANFASLPGQVVECSLSGIKPCVTNEGWTRECIEKLQNLMSSTQFPTAIISDSSSQDTKPSIELYLDDDCTQSVADMLVHSGLASPIDTSPAPKESPPVHPSSNIENSTPKFTPDNKCSRLRIPLSNSTLPTAARFPVIITEVTTLAEIYIQVANRESLELQLQMMKDLNKYCSSVPSCTQLPAVGELCVAQCSDDNWFRAQVTQHLDDNSNATCEVFFFDFGYKELIKVGKLKPISKQLLKWPIQAVKCGMYGVPAKQVLKPMNSDDLFLFQSLLANSDVVQCIVINKDPLFVDFESTGGLSVRDEYVRRGLFPQVSDLGKMSLASNQLSTSDTEMVIVTEKANGPSDFWVQVVDKAAMQEFDKLIELIQEHCVRSSPLAQPLVLGQLCCAKFSEDGVWYRAQVIEIMGEGVVKVLFVDFGNVEKSKCSDLRPVNHVFMHFPAQAVHCCLVGHAVFKEGMQEKFSSLVSDRLLIAANRGKQGLCKTVLELADTSTSQDIYIHKQLQ